MSGLQEGDLLTPAQAVAILPVGRSTLHRLLHAGIIRGLLVRSTGARRGRWLVSRESLERYVRDGLASSTPAPAQRLDADEVMRCVRMN